MNWEDRGAGVAPLSIGHDNQNGGIYILTEVGPNHMADCYTNNSYGFPSGCPTLPIEGILAVSNELFNVRAYPNPFDQIIDLSININTASDVKVDVAELSDK